MCIYAALSITLPVLYQYIKSSKRQVQLHVTTQSIMQLSRCTMGISSSSGRFGIEHCQRQWASWINSLSTTANRMLATIFRTAKGFR